MKRGLNLTASCSSCPACPVCSACASCSACWTYSLARYKHHAHRSHPRSARSARSAHRARSSRSLITTINLIVLIVLIVLMLKRRSPFLCWNRARFADWPLPCCFLTSSVTLEVSPSRRDVTGVTCCRGQVVGVLWRAFGWGLCARVFLLKGLRTRWRIDAHHVLLGAPLRAERARHRLARRAAGGRCLRRLGPLARPAGARAGGGDGGCGGPGRRGRHHARGCWQPRHAIHIRGSSRGAAAL